MKTKNILNRVSIVLFLVLIISESGTSQDSSKILIVSSKVGEMIDSTEKARYNIFPFYSKAEFQSAQFVQMADSSIVLKAIMKDGSIKKKFISEKEFLWTKTIIDGGNKQKFYYPPRHPAEIRTIWVNLGIGGSSIGIAASINGSYQIKNNLISFRYIYSEKFIFFGGTRPDKIRDLGLLYGLSTKNPKGFASISIGISYVEYIEKGKLISCSGSWFSSTCTYEELNYSTVGIPIETQLFLTGRGIGIGIYGFANINTERSYAGAMLSLQIGRLR